MPTQVERTEATRGQLTAAALTLFSEHGFGAVSIDEIVAVAGVTTGALYHHFRDKRELFRAAFAAQEDSLARRLEEVVEHHDDPLDRLTAAATTAIEVLGGKDTKQISTAEAAAVLGLQSWHEVMEDSTLFLWRRLIADAVESGALASGSVSALAYLLEGAITGGTLAVAAGSSSAEITDELRALLSRLRTP